MVRLSVIAALIVAVQAPPAFANNTQVQRSLGLTETRTNRIMPGQSVRTQRRTPVTNAPTRAPQPGTTRMVGGRVVTVAPTSN